MAVQILLLEDDTDLREEVAAYLKGRGGFEVMEASTVRQFYQYFRAEQHKVLILDGLLPDGDGAAIAADVRTNHPSCGVLMFTARDSTQDRIQGYRAGVDHYISKPMRLDELLAIVQALARRVGEQASWTLNRTDWRITSPRGTQVRLTALEYRLLDTLNTRPGTTLSRRAVVENLGKDLAHYDDRNLDALVLRLRRKVLEATPEPLPLKTVHGVGYTLSEALATPHG